MVVRPVSRLLLGLLLVVPACGGDRDAASEGPAAPARPTAAAIDAGVAADAGREVTELVELGIDKVDDVTFEVQRRLLSELAARPATLTAGARLATHAAGLQLQGVGPRSVYSRLGLVDGDLLLSLNGEPLGAANLIRLYRQLRTAESLTLALRRGDQPLTITYRVLDTPPNAPPPAAAPPTAATPPAAASAAGELRRDAMRYYDRTDYENAIKSALAALAAHPDDVGLRRVLVSSYCITGEPAQARVHWRMLPQHDQLQMQRRCSRYGITFDR